MGITENVDEDPCKFAVWTDSGTAGSSEIYFLVVSSPEVKETWIAEVKKLLESQQDFAKGLFYFLSWSPSTPYPYPYQWK